MKIFSDLPEGRSAWSPKGFWCVLQSKIFDSIFLGALESRLNSICDEQNLIRTSKSRAWKNLEELRKLKLKTIVIELNAC